MAGTQALKRRIRSVRNTRQITKAMEVVSANKLRRVQAVVDKARTYSQLASEVINRLPQTADITGGPYFEPEDQSKILYVIFTSDSGLAGAFNTNVQHATMQAISQSGGSDVVVFGRKGARFFARVAKVNLVAEYEGVSDVPDPGIFASLAATIDLGIKSHQYHGLTIVYTEFISALTQKVKVEQILPIKIEKVQEAKDEIVYELEPTPEAAADKAAQTFVHAKLVQAKVEAAASEHAMRMTVMGNATRNADDLVDDLTLELNATRQAAITQEIAEITGGAAAIEQG